MPSNLPSLFRFHLRRLWRMQPIALSACIAAAFAMVAAGAICAQQWQDADEAAREWEVLNQRARTADRPAIQPVKAQPMLSNFRSAQFVDALNRVAQESKLPLDEVVFALDDNGNQPYLRYRATLTVSAGYPAIRRFVDRMRAELADVSLDAISCSRDDIGSTVLRCELALSAFYRKDARG